MLTLRINDIHLPHPINNFGIYIADRHWCIPRVTGGTPCIEPNSRQAYCSKKALHKPDTASFIIRTAVLIGGLSTPCIEEASYPTDVIFQCSR